MEVTRDLVLNSKVVFSSVCKGSRFPISHIERKGLPLDGYSVFVFDVMVEPGIILCSHEFAFVFSDELEDEAKAIPVSAKENPVSVIFDSKPVMPVSADQPEWDIKKLRSELDFFSSQMLKFRSWFLMEKNRRQKLDRIIRNLKGEATELRRELYKAKNEQERRIGARDRRIAGFWYSGGNDKIYPWRCRRKSTRMYSDRRSAVIPEEKVSKSVKRRLYIQTKKTGGEMKIKLEDMQLKGDECICFFPPGVGGSDDPAYREIRMLNRKMLNEFLQKNRSWFFGENEKLMTSNDWVRPMSEWTNFMFFKEKVK